METHSWATVFTDSVDFYNHYLQKFDEQKQVIVDTAAKADSQSLLVIDMQNDFILNPIDSQRPGRFSVSDGLTMAPMLAEFIKTNASKFSKIIFSRDTHTHDHCSFNTTGGAFPPHCVANHDGAAMHDSMMQFASFDNVDVIFKGCHQGTDSFSAVPYVKKNNSNTYPKARQITCPGDGLENTGSRYLKMNDGETDKEFKARRFGPKPFSFDYCEKLPTDCSHATTKAIDEGLSDVFKIEKLLPKTQTDGVHNIYVVGLAGDWCVKDTAMNIMKSLDDGKVNGVAINVYVLQPYVRYPMLPIQLTRTTADDYLNIQPGKDIDKYLFTLVSSLRLLTQAVVKSEEVVKDVTNIKDLANKLANIEKVNNSANEKNAARSILSKAKNDLAKANKNPIYASFITGIHPLLKDYSSTGVKILMNEPDFPKSGGKRRKSRKAPKKSRKQRSRKSRGLKTVD
jgi:nicotinamidase-related amidase